jgi:hypothetical protein
MQQRSDAHVNRALNCKFKEANVDFNYENIHDTNDRIKQQRTHCCDLMWYKHTIDVLCDFTDT